MIKLNDNDFYLFKNIYILKFEFIYLLNVIQY